MLEKFAWKGFRGVRRSSKEHCIQVFWGLRHCLEEFSKGRSIAGFDLNGERFFVKRFRAQLRLWRPLARSKARNAMLNEARWLQLLEDRQVVAPQLWLFMEQRSGRQVETFLVMSELEGRPLALLEDDLFSRGAMRTIELIGKLHKAGLCHGDCNLYNFLVSEEVHAIDFERTAEFSPARAEDDLIKFLSRVKARGQSDLIADLVNAYLKVRPQPLFDIQKLLAMVQEDDSRPIQTRWRHPQFFNITISPPGS